MYSKRRWHQPPHEQSRREHQRTDPTAADALLQSTSGARTENGTLSFKRCRLSASPATGLVGMQENAYAFLSDFFGCDGFMPLTTQSNIRETMVDILARSATRQPTGGRRGNLSTPVANYTQLATDALTSHLGPPNTEVAKVWTILAQLYGFMGNDVRSLFEGPQQETDAFLSPTLKNRRVWVGKSFLGHSSSWTTGKLIPKNRSQTLLQKSSCKDNEDRLKLVENPKVPTRVGISTRKLPDQGFAELIHRGETIKVYSGMAQPGEIKAFCAHQQDPPQLHARGICTHTSPSLRRRFPKLFFEKACENSTTVRARSDDAEPQEEANSCRHRDASLPPEIGDAMVAALQENMMPFEGLEETADRPPIRNGVGSRVISGYLVFINAYRGDADGTRERTTRCIEVFERYPGLCRCTCRWIQTAHFMLAALSALVDSRAEELCCRLRAVYNPRRPL